MYEEHRTLMDMFVINSVGHKKDVLAFLCFEVYVNIVKHICKNFFFYLLNTIIIELFN